MRKTIVGATGVAAILALSGPAGAAHVNYFVAKLSPLSGSGVSGVASLALNTTDQLLSVHIRASGLEPGMLHVQHIHGAFDGAGNPIDSTSPTLAQDLDGDGFIELLEGLTTYGPIIVPLSSPPGGALADFPIAADGTIDFSQTYDLTDPATFAANPTTMVKFTADDLMSLSFREIVLHGMSVDAGFGAGTTGEIDGTAGYKAVLPVASGEITAVPLPAAAWLLAAALGGMGLLRGASARPRNA